MTRTMTKMANPIETASPQSMMTKMKKTIGSPPPPWKNVTKTKRRKTTDIFHPRKDTMTMRKEITTNGSKKSLCLAREMKAIYKEYDKEDADKFGNDSRLKDVNDWGETTPTTLVKKTSRKGLMTANPPPKKTGGKSRSLLELVKYE